MTCPSINCKEVLLQHFRVFPLEGTAQSTEPLGVAAGSKFAESLIRAVFSKRQAPKLKPAVCVSLRAMGTLSKCEQVSRRTIRMSAHIFTLTSPTKCLMKHLGYCYCSRLVGLGWQSNRWHRSIEKWSVFFPQEAKEGLQVCLKDLSDHYPHAMCGKANSN